MFSRFVVFLLSIGRRMDLKLARTRKSCVNARGIPTAAYQVLLGGVSPPPRQDTPPPRPGLVRGGGYLRWGTPIRYPDGQVRRGGGYLGWGTPPARSDGGRGYPRWGTPPRTWLGYPPGWGTPLAGPGQGAPPPGVNRQTDGQTRVKT